MKIMKEIILILLFSFEIAWVLPKVSFIMKQMDDMTKLKGDGSAKVVITQKKVSQGTKIMETIYYRKDSDDLFLIIFTAPESDRGNGYLRSGDNFWMYRRNTRTFQHINRDESIGGSDSKSGDFEKKKITELYKPILDKDGNDIISEGKLGKIPVLKFTLQAKVDDVSYPTVKYWVRKDNYLPLKVQNYSLSGTLMQTNYFLKYTKIEGKFMWVKGIFIDEFEKGNKTIVEIKDISTKSLNKNIFTKSYLENLSK